MGRLTLWWRRNVVGGLHDHEEGDERADCDGCQSEAELLRPPSPRKLRTRVSGPAETSGWSPDGERSDDERPAPEPAAGRRSVEDASSGAAHR